VHLVSKSSFIPASRGKFVTYTAIFLDFGGLEASVGLELLLSLVEPLPRLTEVVTGEGS